MDLLIYSILFLSIVPVSMARPAFPEENSLWFLIYGLSGEMYFLGWLNPFKSTLSLFSFYFRIYGLTVPLLWGNTTYYLTSSSYFSLNAR